MLQGLADLSDLGRDPAPQNPSGLLDAFATQAAKADLTNAHGITEFSTAENMTPKQFKDYSASQKYVHDFVKLGMSSKVKMPNDPQAKAVGDRLKSLAMRAMDSYLSAGERYLASQELAQAVQQTKALKDRKIEEIKSQGVAIGKQVLLDAAGPIAGAITQTARAIGSLALKKFDAELAKEQQRFRAAEAETKRLDAERSRQEAQRRAENQAQAAKDAAQARRAANQAVLAQKKAERENARRVADEKRRVAQAVSGGKVAAATYGGKFPQPYKTPRPNIFNLPSGAYPSGLPTIESPVAGELRPGDLGPVGASGAQGTPGSLFNKLPDSLNPGEWVPDPENIRDPQAPTYWVNTTTGERLMSSVGAGHDILGPMGPLPNTGPVDTGMRVDNTGNQPLPSTQPWDSGGIQSSYTEPSWGGYGGGGFINDSGAQRFDLKGIHDTPELQPYEKYLGPRLAMVGLAALALYAITKR